MIQKRKTLHSLSIFPSELSRYIYNRKDVVMELGESTQRSLQADHRLRAEAVGARLHPLPPLPLSRFPPPRSSVTNAKLRRRRVSTPPVAKEIHHRILNPPPAAAADIQIDIGKADHSVGFPSDWPRPTPWSASVMGTVNSDDRRSERAASGSAAGGSRGIGPEVSHLGWGHRYTLRELEEASGGLSKENVLGEGGYGIVYYGVLQDNTMVAIKNLLNNSNKREDDKYRQGRGCIGHG